MFFLLPCCKYKYDFGGSYLQTISACFMREGTVLTTLWERLQSMPVKVSFAMAGGIDWTRLRLWFLVLFWFQQSSIRSIQSSNR